MGLPWNETSSIQPGPVETNFWAGDHNGTVAMFVALSTVMGGWPIPSCKGVVGILPRKMKSPRRKGVKRVNPISRFKWFQAPHPLGGGGTFL